MDRMEHIERKVDNQASPHHTLRPSRESNHPPEEAHWIQRNPSTNGHHSQFHQPSSSTFPPQSSWNFHSESHDKTQPQHQPQSQNDSFQNLFEKIMEFQAQQMKQMEERQNKMFQELKDDINKLKTSYSSPLPPQKVPNPNSKPSPSTYGKTV